jgi:hypothetical protein
MSPQQLDNLVAPVALYPDPLLGQVLAASTYPLEIAEAQQWLQRNGNLQGAQRVDAARQQNWDPSVQALVAFPDVLALLGNDLRWTTDLGNAFLAQQADVMAAVQAMRARAQANGRLATTPQQVVTTENQNGQSAIEIQPADPQVIYVPVYQPQYVYGAPDYGVYPDLWYPPGFGFGFGFGFLPGIYAGLFFPGWLGWGGWGWGLGWFGGGFGRGLFVNAGFFNRYGFRAGLGAGGFGGHSLWAHDAAHRMGVAYSNRAVASRFGGASRAGAGIAQSNRGPAGGAGASGGYRGFSGANGGNRAATNGYSSAARSASPGYRAGASSQGYRGAPAQGYRGGQSYSAPRGQSFSAPRGQSFSAPRGQSFSAPRGQSYSAPRAQSSAPRSNSAPRSSGGGFSGGHSGGGGGHSGGGGRR